LLIKSEFFSFDTWVYSAFLEDRKIGKKHLPALRLIGRSAFHKHLEKSGVKNEIVCRFWCDEGDTSSVAKYKI
jgi:hypothetical protein